MKSYPTSFIILCSLGLACAIPGVISLVGEGGQLHPMLEDASAGLALLVSAVALIGSGLFPFFIARLQAAELCADQPAD